MATTKAGAPEASPYGRAAGSSGFTLLESLAVLFLLSLMAVLVFPSFTGSSTSRVKSEAGQMGSILRNLDDTSAATKQVLQVTFDFGRGPGEGSEGRTIEWTEPSGGQDAGTVTHTAEFRSLRGVELPSHGLVKEGQLTVFFNPALMPDPMKVYFEEGKSTAVVSYNPISRRTKVEVQGE